jgi:hypothetical protein
MAAAVVVICIVAAGCSSPHQAATPHPAATPDVGTVKGIAWHCAPFADQSPMTVTAFFTSPPSANGTVAGTTTTKGKNRSYELQLRPGTYLLSAPGSGVRAHTITIGKGKTLIADFAIVCA